MAKENFDFIHNIEEVISKGITDTSIDQNANKNETTVAGIIGEVTLPINKLIGYRYLYRKMKELYGKKEAKRLSGLMYDMTIALSDSGKIMSPYCFSIDASRLVIEGRPFGQLPSAPPKRLSSYIAALNETTHQLSNHLAGAVAVGSMMLDASHILMFKEGISLEQLKTDGTIRKYVENCFQTFVHSVNHLSRNSAECVTADTEVLTVEGFKKYNEVKKGDLVYTWNDGKMEIQPIQRVNISEYSGEMHEYRGRDYCQIVTPNHRVLCGVFNDTNNYRLVESSKIIDFKTPLTFPVSFKENDRADYPLSDEEIKMLAIILTDGHLRHDGKSISIAKSPRRAEGMKILEETLEALQLKYTKNLRHSSFGTDALERLYGCCIYDVCREDSKKFIGMLDNNRKRIPDFMYKFSRRQARLFLDTWAKFDGHIAKAEYNKTKLQCDNLEIADGLQHLAVIAGYGSRYMERTIGTNKEPTRYIALYQRENKGASKNKRIHYDGIVWCPTTFNGVVVYRKEGHTFISGNSPFSNVTICDRPKLENLLSDEKMGWYFEGTDKEYAIEYINEVQNIFLDFFDRGDVLNGGAPFRFPILTINATKILDENGKANIEDISFMESLCQREIYRYNIMVSEGSKFSMCCRVKNDLELMKQGGKVNSFGGSEISLGSHRVATINFNRLALLSPHYEAYKSLVKETVHDTVKILYAHRMFILDEIKLGLQPFMQNGYININGMFSTVGIMGIVEASNTMKSLFSHLPEDIIADTLTVLNNEVYTLAEKYGIPINIEQIPGESMAVKLSQIDKEIFGKELVPYMLYSNQFIPLWEDATVWERMDIDGKYNQLLTGGGIAHIGIGERVTPQQAYKLVEYACESGCEHFALNSVYAKCSEGHTNFGDHTVCPECGAEIVEKYTRVVGFFTPVSSWNKTRREWEFPQRSFGGIE